MEVNKEDADRYMEDMRKFTDTINLKKTISTERSGLAGMRDKVVFWRTAWSAGIQFAAIPKEALLWISLMPIAIANCNEAFKWLGWPIAIPLSWGTVTGLCFVLAVFVFGIFAYTRFGTTRRNYEIAALQNPAYGFLYFKILETERAMIAKLEEMKDAHP